MFARRGILIHPEEFEESWLDRVSDAGLNTLGLHPVGGRNAHVSLEEAVAAHPLPRFRLLRQRAAERGIQMEYEAHAMRWLLPRSVFRENPEWFRMNEAGERTDDFNFCVSNSDALSYVAERTQLLARLLDTGSDRYFFWLDDVSGFSCRCPECRRLSPSDQQLRAVNAMLTGLRRYHPNARLCYIAYGDAMDCPTRVEPLDGVFLEYAPIHRDSFAPLSDPDNEKNRRETRSIRELLSFFGRNHSQVLEYWVDNSRFSGWKKPPKRLVLAEEVMKRDVEFYDSLGFESAASFGCYLGEDYRALWGEPPVKRYGEILGGLS